MTVLITLTIAGTDTGPFNLYSNLDGYTSAFETGVSKASLLGGYSSALVPDGTTTIRVSSTGTCTNYIDLAVGTTTTTTTIVPPTTTTTTTFTPPSVSENYDVSVTEPEVCTSPVGIIAYSYSAFGPGVTLYTNNTAPLVPVSGYNYIKDPLSGSIYNLDPIIGVVGSATGSSC